MRIVPRHVTSPAPREVWQEVLKSNAQALVCQTPAWLDYRLERLPITSVDAHLRSLVKRLIGCKDA